MRAADWSDALLKGEFTLIRINALSKLSILYINTFSIAGYTDIFVHALLINLFGAKAASRDKTI